MKRKIHLPNQLNRKALIWLAEEYGKYFPEPWNSLNPEHIDRRRLRRMIPEAIEDAQLCAMIAPRLEEIKKNPSIVVPFPDAAL